MPTWSELPGVSTVMPGSTAPTPSQPQGPSPGAAKSGTPSGRPVSAAASAESRPTSSPAGTIRGASPAGIPHSSQSSPATAPVPDVERPTKPDDDRSTVAASALCPLSRRARKPAGMTMVRTRATRARMLTPPPGRLGREVGREAAELEQAALPALAIAASTSAEARTSSHERCGETAWPSAADQDEASHLAGDADACDRSARVMRAASVRSAATGGVGRASSAGCSTRPGAGCSRPSPARRPRRRARPPA